MQQNDRAPEIKKERIAVMDREQIRALGTYTFKQSITDTIQLDVPFINEIAASRLCVATRNDDK